MTASTAAAANDNEHSAVRGATAIIDLGVEVFADILNHLGERGPLTASAFAEIARRRCRERPRPSGRDRPEVAALLQIADELSPLIPRQGAVVVFLGKPDNAIA